MTLFVGSVSDRCSGAVLVVWFASALSRQASKTSPRFCDSVRFFGKPKVLLPLLSLVMKSCSVKSKGEGRVICRRYLC